LEQEANSSPGDSGMERVHIDDDVSNLLELIQPEEHLVRNLAKNNSPPFERYSPPFVLTSLALLLSTIIRFKSISPEGIFSANRISIKITLSFPIISARPHPAGLDVGWPAHMVWLQVALKNAVT
jgi:hypothetical protein